MLARRASARSRLAALVALALATAAHGAAAQTEPRQPQLVAETATGGSESAGQSGSGEREGEQAADRPPVFVPPSTDRPTTRLRSASSRSAGLGPRLQALVPEKPGRTVSAQPSLFWHVDRVPSADVSVVFSLTSETREEPVARVPLEAPTRAGIQRIRLETLGITLEPDVLYEWAVELVVDPERRRRSVYAYGGLERVAPPDALASRLAARSPSAHPHVYAELGLWYDALASASDRVDAAPGDPVPRGVRASLLRQVGLDGLAAD